jgi:hypothetical protein
VCAGIPSAAAWGFLSPAAFCIRQASPEIDSTFRSNRYHYPGHVGCKPRRRGRRFNSRVEFCGKTGTAQVIGLRSQVARKECKRKQSSVRGLCSQARSRNCRGCFGARRWIWGGIGRAHRQRHRQPYYDKKMESPNCC